MRNPKTTILGAIAAVLAAIDPIIHSLEDGELTKTSMVRLAFAASLALFAYFAKDKEDEKKL